MAFNLLPTTGLPSIWRYPRKRRSGNIAQNSKRNYRDQYDPGHCSRRKNGIMDGTFSGHQVHSEKNDGERQYCKKVLVDSLFDMSM